MSSYVFSFYVSLVGGRPINFEGQPPPSQSVFGAHIILTCIKGEEGAWE